MTKIEFLVLLLVALKAMEIAIELARFFVENGVELNDDDGGEDDEDDEYK
jgi:hypothetical protein